MPRPLTDFFPMAAMREKQAKALEFIQRVFERGYRDIVVAVPTGGGKTGIGVAACHWGRTSGLDGDLGGYYLVAQKMLQTQLETDTTKYKPEFRSVASLKSATEYACPKHGNCATGGKPKKNGKPCSFRFQDRCAYQLAKKQFLGATVGATNYAYFFTERYYAPLESRMPNRQILVLDECHNLEKIVLSFVDLGVSESFLHELGVPCPIPPNLNTLPEYTDWVREVLLEEVKTQHEMALMMAEGGNPADAQRESKLDQYMAKLSKGAELIEDNPAEWVFWKDKNREKKLEYMARPLNAAPYFKDLVQNNASLRLYMSAFPGTKDVFCRSLGMDPKKVAWCSLGSTFPVENRKIIFAPVGSMSKRNIETTLPSFLRVLLKILDRHSNEKGVIHSVSYALGDIIQGFLNNTPHASRILYPKKADERDAIFATHCQSLLPTIILTPSMGEGFDFADEKARFQIIAKCPYLSLGDHQIVAKMEQDPVWYTVETCKAIIQMSGRAVRSENDHAISYILDSDFGFLLSKSKDIFPNWWKKALVKM